ncbi:hypothetical protein GUITHDRAFT_150204 [Guillardia theta CCMP2712]|uniref:Uncharacterized protein n=2 Tax=Guillardia theta TaxID=55529 RepID=L1K1D7_GUITC|nr:hypothetical protein GUITHDRAFT_150204 [Guillardia theta CCMP2712]EKX54260.1 hypothetical protein GUITHDRAFT_150204 [Guillardia theta CCMP2712]|mmetsp:Transcript_46668/g.146316  ORF Transcript_46668/g.146316 Transcript_46668/m.146316 type:complete len:347 (+) Transcript_46668:107-1147(+)|eukprot:XP_005841240.1 hypothetical protein GUITHDRAFT_150204 [Guillardia theta CCMP2712]
MQVDRPDDDAVEKNDDKEDKMEEDSDNNKGGASDSEEGNDADPEAKESGALAMRNKLHKIVDAKDVDLASAYNILDALQNMWDSVSVRDIVIGEYKSLGMLVRRLRKHEDEQMQKKAGILHTRYHERVTTEYEALMAKMNSKKRKSKPKDTESKRKKKKRPEDDIIDDGSEEERSETKKRKKSKRKEKSKEKDESEKKRKRKDKESKKKRKRKQKESSSEEEKVSEEEEEEEEEQIEKQSEDEKSEEDEKKKGKEDEEEEKEEEKEDEQNGKGDVEEVEGQLKAKIKQCIRDLIVEKDGITNLTRRMCKERISKEFGLQVLEDNVDMIKQSIEEVRTEFIDPEDAA